MDFKIFNFAITRNFFRKYNNIYKLKFIKRNACDILAVFNNAFDFVILIEKLFYGVAELNNSLGIGIG